MIRIQDVEKRIGYVFGDKGLLLRALTHSSFAYEHQTPRDEDNELLEFLGDSVIGLVAAGFYYNRFPGRTEGELSKLKSSVSSTLALAEFARKIKLDKSILLGRGEEKCGGRKKSSILAGALEALMGAIFLDAGFGKANDYFTGLLAGALKPLRFERFLINNYKSALQEYFQKMNSPSPSYRTVTEKGPDHKKTFMVEVCLQGRSLAKAKGASRKSAEQKAAQKALKKLLGRKMKVLTPEAFIVKDES